MSEKPRYNTKGNKRIENLEFQVNLTVPLFGIVKFPHEQSYTNDSLQELLLTHIRDTIATYKYQHLKTIFKITCHNMPKLNT